MADEKKRGFTKQFRLLASPQFRQVFDNRHSAADGHLIIYACHNGLPISRLGLAVSKKIGNAVVRNRWKRRIREAFRLQRAELPTGFDWVVLAKRGATPEQQAISASLLALTKRLAKRKPRKSNMGKRP